MYAGRQNSITLREARAALRVTYFQLGRRRVSIWVSESVLGRPEIDFPTKFDKIWISSQIDNLVGHGADLDPA